MANPKTTGFIGPKKREPLPGFKGRRSRFEEPGRSISRIFSKKGERTIALLKTRISNKEYIKRD